MAKYMKKFWKDNLILCLLLLGSAGSQTIASVINANAMNALIELDFQGFFETSLKMFVIFMFLLVFTYLRIVKQT